MPVEQKPAPAAATTPGQSSAVAASAPAKSVRTYDFRRPNHLSAEQMRNIHRVHVVAAESLQSRLSRYLGVNLETRVEAAEELAYGLFCDSLPEHVFGSILDLNPLPEKGLLLVDSPLCLSFVDRALGGACRKATHARPLTAIDQAAAESSIEMVLRSLREAWKELFALKLTVLERRNDARQVSLVPRSETVLAVTLRLTGDLDSCHVRLCLPLGSLKKTVAVGAHTSAMRPATEKAGEIRGQIQRSLERAPLSLTAVIGNTEMPLGALRKLKAGDVVVLNCAADSPVALHVGGRPAFTGKMGLRGRRKAVQVTSRVVSPEEE